MVEDGKFELKFLLFLLPSIRSPRRSLHSLTFLIETATDRSHIFAIP